MVLGRQALKAVLRSCSHAILEPADKCMPIKWWRACGNCRISDASAEPGIKTNRHINDWEALTCGNYVWRAEPFPLIASLQTLNSQVAFWCRRSMVRSLRKQQARAVIATACTQNAWLCGHLHWLDGATDTKRAVVSLQERWVNKMLHLNKMTSLFSKDYYVFIRWNLFFLKINSPLHSTVFHEDVSGVLMAPW